MDVGRPFEFDWVHEVPADETGVFPIPVPMDGLVTSFQFGTMRLDYGSYYVWWVGCWVESIEYGSRAIYQNESGLAPISTTIREGGPGLCLPSQTIGLLKPLVVRQGGNFMVRYRSEGDPSYPSRVQVHVQMYGIPSHVNKLISQGAF